MRSAKVSVVTSAHLLDIYRISPSPDSARSLAPTGNLPESCLPDAEDDSSGMRAVRADGASFYLFFIRVQLGLVSGARCLSAQQAAHAHPAQTNVCPFPFCDTLCDVFLLLATPSFAATRLRNTLCVPGAATSMRQISRAARPSPSLAWQVTALFFYS
jgi:hypothetical protein